MYKIYNNFIVRLSDLQWRNTDFIKVLCGPVIWKLSHVAALLTHTLSHSLPFINTHPLTHTLLVWCAGLRVTRRSGSRRRCVCPTTWTSDSVRSTAARVWDRWSGMWRTTTSPLSATTAGERNSTVWSTYTTNHCVPPHSPINLHSVLMRLNSWTSKFPCRTLISSLHNVLICDWFSSLRLTTPTVSSMESTVTLEVLKFMLVSVYLCRLMDSAFNA